jgi:hypothetical protein
MGSEERGDHATWKWLEGFRGMDLTDTEVEAAAERLLADRETALPILLTQFTDPEEDAALLAVTTVTLKGWGEPYPIEPLLGLLRSRDVGALGKALIMNVLERYGVDVDGTGLVGTGINLEEFEVEGGPGLQGVSQN